jgi:membrane protein implicated in regulation of membrane protease activity
MPDEPRTTERDVRSEDPSLSPHANDLLTGALRDAVGSDRAEVPVGNVDHRRDSHGGHSPFLGPFVAMGLPLIMLLFVAAITLGVLGVAAGGAWVVVGVFVALLLALAAVLGAIGRLTAEQEHLDPTTVAELEDEGVVNPDRAFNELVVEFTDDAEDRDAHEIATPGDNERDHRAEDDPAQATAEQRTAMTPSSEATTPVGPGSDED